MATGKLLPSPPPSPLLPPLPSSPPLLTMSSPPHWPLLLTMSSPPHYVLSSSSGLRPCTCSSGRPASGGLYRMLLEPQLSQRDCSQQLLLPRPQLSLYRHPPSLRPTGWRQDGKRRATAYTHTYTQRLRQSDNLARWVSAPSQRIANAFSHYYYHRSTRRWSTR